MLRFVFVLLAVVYFSQSNISVRQVIACSTGDAQCKPCLRPPSTPDNPVYNKFADVTNIEVEKSELHIPPKKDSENDALVMREMTVGVKTTAEDPEGDVLTYNYTVSGGRIVGTGANVSWSLYGVQAGTYTISAGVDDGCGVCGKTETRSVVVIQD